MEIDLTFARELKKARLAKRITGREVARICGISGPYYSQIESGKRGRPSPDKCKQLASALETKFSDPDICTENRDDDFRARLWNAVHLIDTINFLLSTSDMRDSTTALRCCAAASAAKKQVESVIHTPAF